MLYKYAMRMLNFGGRFIFILFLILFSVYFFFCEGAVTLQLACSTPDRAVRVRVLAEDIVLCSWARHFTLTVLLSTQVYK